MGIINNLRERQLQQSEDMQQPQPFQAPVAAGAFGQPQSHADMAREQWGFTGWNKNNIWGRDDMLGKASAFQQQGGQTAGLRDWLSNSADQFLNPYAASYRATYGADATADDDATLYNDPKFRDYVMNGYRPPQSVEGSGAGAESNNPAQLQQGAGDPRRQQLYDVLMGRINRSETIDPNDPILRSQADAFSAQQERARRKYLNGVAEASGPLANIQGERRMAAERAGIANSQFMSNLMAQELNARRQQAAQALTQAGGILDADQKADLQERLANLDATIKSKGMSLQDKGLNQDWQRTLLQNDQFLRQLGLNEWDRTNYWDALRSGALG